MRPDEGAISRRYAKAAMSWCNEHGGHDELLRGLSAMADAIDSVPALDKLLNTPMLKKEQKLRLVEETAGRVKPGAAAVRFLSILVQRGRLEYLRPILKRLGEMMDEKAGRVKAAVTTAVALDPPLRNELQVALSKALNREAVCSFFVDESLYAGVVARVGNTLIDSSIRGRLDRLRQRIHALTS